VVGVAWLGGGVTVGGWCGVVCGLVVASWLPLWGVGVWVGAGTLRGPSSVLGSRALVVPPWTPEVCVMSLLSSSRAAAYRPAPPPASILRELVVEGFDQRFDACVAVAATVWGYGLNMCRTVAERRAWMDAYFEHLRLALSARSGVESGPGGSP